MATHALMTLSCATRPISGFTLFTTKTISSPQKTLTLAMASAPSSTTAKVAPAIIVGGGRVRRALQEIGSGQDLLVKRGEPVPLDFEGPILVCTRNDNLVLFLNPLQSLDGANGMLEPWFQSKGLGEAHQVLAYFAVAKLGEPPIDGKTDTNPEGLTAAYGKWASTAAARLQAGSLSCKANVNLAGLPALVLPCGFDEEGPTGRPVGLQMIGAAFDEEILLKVGHIFEQTLQGCSFAPPLILDGLVW